MNYVKVALLLCLFTHGVGAAVSHNPEKFLHDIQGQSDEGQQIVKQYCSTCHASHPMIALGAPRIGSKKDWEPRVKQGLDTLFLHTTEGFNAMPARGGCFECSDQQLREAIAFLLGKETKKEH